MASKSTNLLFLYKITPETLKKFEENCVYFKKPELVAYYDYLDGFIVKASSIKYLKHPDTLSYPMDLNKGFHEYTMPKTVSLSRQIKPSLIYYDSLSDDLDDTKNMRKTKVITRRGTLVRLMETHYNNVITDLTIRVTRYNGNLYMILDQKELSDSELNPVHTHHKHLERFIFSDAPDIPPILYEPIDENFYQIGVHRSSFGKYDIIYSGEMQGIISNEEIEDFDARTLNDCRFVFTKQMWWSYKDQDTKYLRIWLQSYLANVQDLYIGYKNRHGIIEKPIEHNKAKDLPKDRFWKPVICTGFLHEFLENVEKCMSSVNCLNTVYEFHYDQEEKSFSYEIFNGKSDKSFIIDNDVQIFFLK
ncbi:decapping nuclease DXO homolog [Lucilia sericata]|uniref:decapping nuclease DXO homolog n=1 Tax=Lucilia sericata TaxID=13632 RepID=UPI0018A7E8BC|nr:decapping nuclease DXO homolog [Lucilia sericata]